MVKLGYVQLVGGRGKIQKKVSEKIQNLADRPAYKLWIGWGKTG